MAHRVKVGVVGAWANIFPAYAAGCRAFFDPGPGCSGRHRHGQGREQATEHGVPRSLSVDALLADPEIEIVVNLTVPKVHAAVSLAAIAAGKHVYSEKPLAIDRASGQQILQAAAEQGVRVARVRISSWAAASRPAAS